ncbi:MAG: hypothetical protein AB8U44_01020 [Aaplasma endosymbiont of Hyalomma asiaticum]
MNYRGLSIHCACGSGMIFVFAMTTLVELCRKLLDFSGMTFIENKIMQENSS